MSGFTSVGQALSPVRLLLALSGLAAAQQPAIAPDGVRNAASLVGVTRPGHGVAPRSIVTILGTNLAARAETAAPGPLPRRLAGTSVTFNGIEAPLSYVSPNQINAQAPSALAGAASVSIIVSTDAGQSEPVTVPVVPLSPGIFTQGASGCGQGAVLNIHRDGSFSLNTPENSADPARDAALAVLATGLGVHIPPVPDGELANFTPRPILDGDVRANFGGQTWAATYSHPALGLVGVDQVTLDLTALIPFWLPPPPQGCRVPLYLTDQQTYASQPVAVSIRTGGGVCVDPPPDSLGLIRWERKPGSDALAIEFSEAIGIYFLRSTVASEQIVGACYTGPVQPSPTPCADLAPRKLDAGVVSVSGPAIGTLRLEPPDYRAELAPGAIMPGRYRVVAEGGRDVGGFDSSVVIPPPIEIDLEAGAEIAGRDGYRLRWRGGSPASVVRAQMVYPSRPGTGGLGFTVDCDTPGDAGQLLLRPFRQDALPAGDAELVVVMTPHPETIPTLRPRGLTRGLRQIWRYEFRFPGLKVQK